MKNWQTHLPIGDHDNPQPVEWNAGFRRALPILEEGGYLGPTDMEGARRILKAAALTYLASSLFSLVNMWRWIRLVWC